MQLDHDSQSVLSQLGKRIRYLRTQKGLTQLDLAVDASITTSYLSNLEAGKRNPSVAVLNQLCSALGISLEELFRGIVPF